MGEAVVVLSKASKRRSCAWVFAPAIAMALPAHAEDWTVPAGCQIFLTVQSKECRVSNFYSCVADQEGDRWQADFDPEGLRLLIQTNAETVPLQIIDPRAGTHWIIDATSAMPPTLSALLTEPATFPDYRMFERNGDVAEIRGFRQRLPASEEVNAPAASVTIDGTSLQTVIFNIDRSTNEKNSQQVRKGTEYLHLEWRLFFAGPEQQSKPGNISAFEGSDGSPVNFIFPGEPDFGTTRPSEDCELMLSELASAPVPTLFQYTKGPLP